MQSISPNSFIGISRVLAGMAYAVSPELSQMDMDMAAPERHKEQWEQDYKQQVGRAVAKALRGMWIKRPPASLEDDDLKRWAGAFEGNGLLDTNQVYEWAKNHAMAIKELRAQQALELEAAKRNRSKGKRHARR